MAEQLKTCPFCNGKAKFIAEEKRNIIVCQRLDYPILPVRLPTYECRNCGCIWQWEPDPEPEKDAQE